MRAIPAVLALLLAAMSATASAQPIYRCGDSYSQQPCAGGTPIEAGPPPTPVERKQSAAATQRDAKLADSLEKDRLRRETQPTQLYIPPPKFEAAPGPRQSPEKAATRKLDLFTASAPGSKPPKEKKQKGKARKGAADPGKSPQQGSGAGAGTLAVRR